MAKLIIPEGTEPDQTVTHCLDCGYWLRGLPAHGRCPECGNPYDKFGGVWRSGKTLIMGKSVLLPRRCIKCNAPVDELTFKRKLSWHHPLVYLLLLLGCFFGGGLLLYILVAYLVSKKAVIFVGLCPQHEGKRRVLMVVFGVLFAAAILMIYTAFAVEHPGPALAAGVSLVGCIVMAYVVQSVTTKRIDEHFIWLRGVHTEYLAELPELPDSMRR